MRDCIVLPFITPVRNAYLPIRSSSVSNLVLKSVEQQNVGLGGMGEKKGARAVIANDNINYRRPARYNDTLAITCCVAEIGESL